MNVVVKDGMVSGTDVASLRECSTVESILKFPIDNEKLVNFFREIINTGKQVHSISVTEDAWNKIMSGDISYALTPRKSGVVVGDGIVIYETNMPDPKAYYSGSSYEKTGRMITVIATDINPMDNVVVSFKPVIVE